MLIFREDLEKNRWTCDLDSFSSRNNLNELEEKCNNSSCFDGRRNVSKIARDPLDDRAEMTERRETGGRGSYISIIKANTPLRGAHLSKTEHNNAFCRSTQRKLSTESSFPFQSSPPLLDRVSRVRRKWARERQICACLLHNLSLTCPPITKLRDSNSIRVNEHLSFERRNLKRYRENDDSSFEFFLEIR